MPATAVVHESDELDSIEAERGRRQMLEDCLVWRREKRVAATVMIVEDDHNIGNLVQTYLRRDGYAVVWASSGEEALRELTRHPVTLVILDVGLPGIDGFDVCRQLRTRSQVPIIMLTARDEEADRIVGLELGADDYVVKPFSPRELMARVKAVLRRVAPAPSEVLVVGALEVRLAAREARLEGSPVELTQKEFDLLAYFAANAGIALSRDQLLEHVWGFSFAGGTRTVDQHVAQLRSKLGSGARIETLRGVGYKLVKR